MEWLYCWGSWSAMKNKKNLILAISIAAVVIAAISVCMVFLSGGWQKNLKQSVESVLSFPYEDAEALEFNDVSQLGQYRGTVQQYYSDRYSAVMTDNCAKSLIDPSIQFAFWILQDEYTSKVADLSLERDDGTDHGSFTCTLQIMDHNKSVVKALPMSGRFQIAEDNRVNYIGFDGLQLTALSQLLDEYFPDGVTAR